MTLYTFYPYSEDNTSFPFVSMELDEDETAKLRAIDVLDAHPEAMRVVVWCGGRQVHTRARMDPTLWALLSRGDTRTT